MHSRVEPLNRESPFAMEELFFSRTDSHGIILAGNDVFVRVSAYPKEQMIGSPHNVIRHPDMPRAVFKLLWDMIQAGKPIGAYVKNMASDGSYYWVFAVVFPVPQGYISIRLKPSTALFGKVQAVYRQVLECERKSGVEASGALLFSILKDAGFKDYPAFMTQALIGEVSARASYLNQHKKTDSHAIDGSADESSASILSGCLRDIEKKCDQASSDYINLFGRLEGFSRNGKIFQEKTEFILNSCRDLSLLSVNMAVAADRSGESGRTLTVVAQGFRANSQEIEKQLEVFRDAIQRLSLLVQSTEFEVAASRLQGDMVQFFVKEFRTKLQNGFVASDLETQDMRSNCLELVNLASSFATTIIQRMTESALLLKKFSREAEQLESAVIGLEVIRQSGSVEVARSELLRKEFEAHIEKMNHFVRSVTGPTREMSEAIRALVTESAEINRFLSGLLQQLKSVAASAESVKSA